MKEEEARKKWCPMTRAGVEQTEHWCLPKFLNRAVTGWNRNVRGDDIVDGCNCIASDCACWVVESGAKNELGDYVGASGHCGLAR